MTVQHSVAVRNAALDAREVAIGVSAVLKIREGAQPADCAAADSGTVLATLSLPADWMNAASGGTKTLKGTWEDLSADATGTAAHWRLYASDGTTCGMQGDVTDTLGSGSLKVSSTAFTAGGTFSVTGFTWTEGNA